ncbi:hypothetical protein [Nocardia sp. XZ_19_385]|nr:hypothetical protein [Nocardia sp. XZ_19_385]
MTQAQPNSITGNGSTTEVVRHRDRIDAGDDFDAPHWRSVELPWEAR